MRQVVADGGGTVAVPAEMIWAVLMDTGRYGEWNLILVRAEGRFEARSTMRHRMKTGDVGTTPVACLVTRRSVRPTRGRSRIQDGCSYYRVPVNAVIRVTVSATGYLIESPLHLGRG